MVVTIAMLLFIVVLLITAWYIWNRRHGRFLTYDIGNNPFLSKVLSVTAIALLIVSIIGIIILFMGNRYLNLITIGLASLVIFIFGIILNNKG